MPIVFCRRCRHAVLVAADGLECSVCSYPLPAEDDHDAAQDLLPPQMIPQTMNGSDHKRLADAPGLHESEQEAGLPPALAPETLESSSAVIPGGKE